MNDPAQTWSVVTVHSPTFVRASMGASPLEHSDWVRLFLGRSIARARISGVAGSPSAVEYLVNGVDLSGSAPRGDAAMTEASAALAACFGGLQDVLTFHRTRISNVAKALNTARPSPDSPYEFVLQVYPLLMCVTVSDDPADWIATDDGLVIVRWGLDLPGHRPLLQWTDAELASMRRRVFERARLRDGEGTDTTDREQARAAAEVLIVGGGEAPAPRQVGLDRARRRGLRFPGSSTITAPPSVAVSAPADRRSRLDWAHYVLGGMLVFAVAAAIWLSRHPRVAVQSGSQFADRVVDSSEGPRRDNPAAPTPPAAASGPGQPRASKAASNPTSPSSPPAPNVDDRRVRDPARSTDAPVPVATASAEAPKSLPDASQSVIQLGERLKQAASEVLGSYPVSPTAPGSGEGIKTPGPTVSDLFAKLAKVLDGPAIIDNWQASSISADALHDLSKGVEKLSESFRKAHAESSKRERSESDSAKAQTQAAPKSSEAAQQLQFAMLAAWLESATRADAKFPGPAPRAAADVGGSLATQWSKEYWEVVRKATQDSSPQVDPLDAPSAQLASKLEPLWGAPSTVAEWNLRLVQIKAGQDFSIGNENARWYWVRSAAVLPELNVRNSFKVISPFGFNEFHMEGVLLGAPAESRWDEFRMSFKAGPGPQPLTWRSFVTNLAAFKSVWHQRQTSGQNDPRLGAKESKGTRLPVSLALVALHKLVETADAAFEADVIGLSLPDDAVSAWKNLKEFRSKSSDLQKINQAIELGYVPGLPKSDEDDREPRSYGKLREQLSGLFEAIDKVVNAMKKPIKREPPQFVGVLTFGSEPPLPALVPSYLRPSAVRPSTPLELRLVPKSGGSPFKIGLLSASGDATFEDSPSLRPAEHLGLAVIGVPATAPNRQPKKQPDRPIESSRNPPHD